MRRKQPKGQSLALLSRFPGGTENSLLGGEIYVFFLCVVLLVNKY